MMFRKFSLISYPSKLILVTIAFLTLNLGFSVVLIGQNTIIEPMIFHGYDISLTKITDPKRTSQQVASYMLELVNNVSVEVTSKQLSKWLGVKRVIIEGNTTFEKNRKVKNEDILYPNYVVQDIINSDSLQKIINKLDIQEKRGTGVIVFFECLSKERKSVSGYVCFFNHYTGKIITVVEKEFKDNNGYGSFRDYWVPAIGLVRFGCEKFRSEYNPK